MLVRVSLYWATHESVIHRINSNCQAKTQTRTLTVEVEVVGGQVGWEHLSPGGPAVGGLAHRAEPASSADSAVTLSNKTRNRQYE